MLFCGLTIELWSIAILEFLWFCCSMKQNWHRHVIVLCQLLRQAHTHEPTERTCNERGRSNGSADHIYSLLWVWLWVYISCIKYRAQYGVSVCCFSVCIATYCYLYCYNHMLRCEIYDRIRVFSVCRWILWLAHSQAAIWASYLSAKKQHSRGSF